MNTKKLWTLQIVIAISVCPEVQVSINKAVLIDTAWWTDSHVPDSTNVEWDSEGSSSNASPLPPQPCRQQLSPFWTVSGPSWTALQEMGLLEAGKKLALWWWKRFNISHVALFYMIKELFGTTFKLQADANNSTDEEEKEL